MIILLCTILNRGLLLVSLLAFAHPCNNNKDNNSTARFSISHTLLASILISPTVARQMILSMPKKQQNQILSAIILLCNSRHSNQVHIGTQYDQTHTRRLSTSTSPFHLAPFCSLLRHIRYPMHRHVVSCSEFHSKWSRCKDYKASKCLMKILEVPHVAHQGIFLSHNLSLSSLNEQDPCSSIPINAQCQE